MVERNFESLAHKGVSSEHSITVSGNIYGSENLVGM